MSFNKRRITKDGIIHNIGNIEKYLNADAIFLDKWSSSFINDLNTEERAIRIKIKEDQRFLSGCPDTHSDYNKLNSLAESLIGLLTDPNWLDIHFVNKKLSLPLDIKNSGIFETQKEICINAIIDYYERG